MTILNYEIKDFIGIFETDCDTDAFIDYFESINANETYNIFNSNSSHQSSYRNDTQLMLRSYGNDTQNSQLADVYDAIVGECLNIYLKEHNNFHLDVDNMRYTNPEHRKIQKTEVGGGFHRFHYENSFRYIRWGVTSLYLNDVKDGGETEFIYQNMRIKPKRGNFIMFPAGHTHVHRGNPPLSNTKYITTSWIHYEPRNI